MGNVAFGLPARLDSILRKAGVQVHSASQAGHPERLLNPLL